MEAQEEGQSRHQLRGNGAAVVPGEVRSHSRFREKGVVREEAHSSLRPAGYEKEAAPEEGHSRWLVTQLVH